MHLLLQLHDSHMTASGATELTNHLLRKVAHNFEIIVFYEFHSALVGSPHRSDDAPAKEAGLPAYPLSVRGQGRPEP